MPTNALLPLLQQRLPGLLAVYAFGSRVKQGGAQARADSDLDLAVLVEGRADPVLLFELMGELTDVVGCPVDLLDLRAASTVMRTKPHPSNDVWLGSKKSMQPTPPRSLSISAGKTPPF